MGQKLTFACALCILALGGRAVEPVLNDAELVAAKKRLTRNFLRDLLNEDQFVEATKFLAAA